MKKTKKVTVKEFEKLKTLPDVVHRLSDALGDLQEVGKMDDGALATFLEAMVHDIRKDSKDNPMRAIFDSCKIQMLPREGIDYREEQKQIIAEQNAKCACEAKCNANIPVPGKGSDVKAIHAACNRVEYRQEDLYKLLANLADKLGPLLSPEKTEPCSDACKAMCGSPLAERIESMAARTDNQCMTVVRLLDRLEI